MKEKESPFMLLLRQIQEIAGVKTNREYLLTKPPFSEATILSSAANF